MRQKEKSAGQKFDAGKPSLELLPPSYWAMVGSELSQQLAAWYFYGGDFPKNFGYDATIVLDFGAKKYSAHNWHKGMRWGRLVGAFHRHANRFDEELKLWVPRDLDEKDEESGLPHGQHAECCRLFLNEYYEAFNSGIDIGENDCSWAPSKGQK
jgi:hypothetical protein